METISKPRFKVFCDVETSGNCPVRNGVISATFLVTDEKLNIIDEFSSKVCPPMLSPQTWSLEAAGIHGQLLNDVLNYKSNDQFCYEFLCFISKYKDSFPLDFVCHASAKGWFMPNEGWIIYPWFDYNFIEWCFRKAKFGNGNEMVWSFYKVFSPQLLESTVEMSRAAGHKKNKLSDCAKRIGFNLNHHDDRSDTFCCLEVYKHLQAGEKQKWELA